jgi:hypothetical protein
MEHYFAMDHLDVERLLAEWRWLIPQPMSLVARNAFGDLFLRDGAGRILKLDVAIGSVTEIADSPAQFQELSRTKEKQEEWFLLADQLAAAKRGLKPNADQCIAFKIPVVFAESGSPNNAFVGDIYEQVSFLGDLHRQISELPDGSKIRLRVKE